MNRRVFFYIFIYLRRVHIFRRIAFDDVCNRGLIVNCAVVVGGTSMAGGVGGVWQSAIGVLFFSALEITLQNLVPNAYIIQLIQGFVIVAILFLDSYDNKRKRERV